MCKQLILACAIACALQGQDLTVPPGTKVAYVEYAKKLSPLEIERLKRIDAELNVIDIQFQVQWEKTRTPKVQEKNEVLEPKCKAAGIELADCVPDMKTGALTKRVPPPNPAPAKSIEPPSNPAAK